MWRQLALLQAHRAHWQIMWLLAGDGLLTDSAQPCMTLSIHSSEMCRNRGAAEMKAQDPQLTDQQENPKSESIHHPAEVMQHL